MVRAERSGRRLRPSESTAERTSKSRRHELPSGGEPERRAVVIGQHERVKIAAVVGLGLVSAACLSTGRSHSRWDARAA